MTVHDEDTTIAADCELLDLADQELVRDPFTAYGPVREREQMARGHVQGVDPILRSRAYGAPARRTLRSGRRG